MRVAERTVVTALLLLAVTACTGKDDGASPYRTPAASTHATPGPTDWLSALESDGTALYMTAHACSGTVELGHCTTQGDFPPPLEPQPVALWRYDGRQWVALGRPGVDSVAEMHAFPGGLLFVPRSAEPEALSGMAGPLRVSSDEGRTWEDWTVPDPDGRCGVSYDTSVEACKVVVAGAYLVVAGEGRWLRRGLRAGAWEDITPPAVAGRRPSPYGYESGALALRDGTLVATVNPIDAGEPGGYYQVLRSGSTTWSAPRDNPGGASQVLAVEGATVFAPCFVPGTVRVNEVEATRCGEYRTTDLEHWTRVDLPAGTVPEHGAVCTRVPPRDGSSMRESTLSERVGRFVYALTEVPFVHGREATRATLASLDHPHRIRHVLERSADGCRTWAEVLR